MKENPGMALTLDGAGIAAVQKVAGEKENLRKRPIISADVWPEPWLTITPKS